MIMTKEELAIAQLTVLVRRVKRALRAHDQRDLVARQAKLTRWAQAHHGQDLTYIVNEVLAR